MLSVGDTAPDFEAADQNGENVRLAAWLERGPVIVYFYPADFSPVCTAQACAFRDRAGPLDEAGCRILGVSPQSAASHRRFATAHGLTFPLLSDTDKTIIRAYGVDGPLGFGVRRATFLIDTDGRIKNRVVSDLFLGSHTAFLNAVLTGAAQEAGE
jgi:peroxiredoxin Q/BCP